MYSHFLKKEFIKNSFQLKKNISSLFSFAILHYRRTRYSCIIKRNAIFDNSSINKRSQFPETVSIIIGAKNSNRIRNPPLPPPYIGIYLVLICTRKAWPSNFYVYQVESSELCRVSKFSFQRNQEYNFPARNKSRNRDMLKV